MTPEEKLARRWGALADEAHGCRQPNYEFLLEAATAFVRMGEALRETGVGMLVDTDASDDHDWIEDGGISWCQWCGVHKVEVPDWADRPKCRAFVKVRAALAAFDALMEEQA